MAAKTLTQRVRELEAEVEALKALPVAFGALHADVRILMAEKKSRDLEKTFGVEFVSSDRKATTIRVKRADLLKAYEEVARFSSSCPTAGKILAEALKL